MHSKKPNPDKTPQCCNTQSNLRKWYSPPVRQAFANPSATNLIALEGGGDAGPFLVVEAHQQSTLSFRNRSHPTWAAGHHYSLKTQDTFCSNSPS